MKKTKTLTLFLGLMALLLLPVLPANAASPYHVNRYGELTRYSGGPSVTIPANVSAISNSAFDDVKVTSFQVNRNNPYFRSINGALYNKSGTLLIRVPSEKKGSFQVPNSVKTIENSAFFQCKRITSITMGNQVKTIRSHAFNRCERLEKITLSDQIKTIPFYCFYNCYSLENVHFPKNLETVSEGAFSNNDALKSVALSNRLEVIENSAFSNCRSLTRVSLPKANYILHSYAFYGCTSLTSVSLGGMLSEIPSHAFSDCFSLKKVTGISDINWIKDAAFENCKALSDFTFPKGLEEIGNRAFLGCKSLTTISLSKDLESIGHNAFSGAGQRFVVQAGNEVYSSVNGLLLNKKKTRLIQVPAQKTGELTMPSSVKKMAKNALCYSQITSLVFSDQIETLSKRSFFECPNLKTVTLPKNLKSFNDKYVEPVDLNTDHLSNLKISKDNENFQTYDGALYNKKGTQLLFAPYGKTKKLTLHPNCKFLNYQLNSNRLTMLAITKSNPTYSCIDGVLYDRSGKTLIIFPMHKTSYVVPKKVRSLDKLNRRKYSCYLSPVQVSKENPKYYAKDGVLFTNSGDTLFYYPPRKSGAYTIPDSARHIADNAFSYCSKLSKLTISKNISRSSGTVYNLDDCTSLKELTVKQGDLNSINVDFYGCDKIKKITLPSTIMKMKFYNLPKGVAIYGWDNTAAKKIAKTNKGTFISLGTIPKAVSGIRAKKIIDRYEISWNASSGADGYQVYTSYETLKTVSGHNSTSCRIKGDLDNYSTIYVRAYAVKNGHKIYGKAKAFYH